MFTIVLADDHPVVRSGLRHILEESGFASIVGEASSGDEALAVIESATPDIAVIDIVMPGMDGLELARAVKQNVPATRIIVLSVHAEENYVREALKNGCEGYVVKESGAIEIRLAVQTVMDGWRYLSPRVSQPAIASYVEQARKSIFDPYDSLTCRERQVMQLTAEGFSSREVGARLSISPRTVETHREHIMHKLGVSNIAGLIGFALRKGIGPSSLPGR